MTDKPKPPIVEPDETSDEERHNYFTQLAIKSEAELRKHLDPHSVSNGRMYAPDVRKARDYVISIMLDEVEKAAISCLATSEFILGSQKEETTKVTQAMKDEMPQLEGNIFQSRIDEMVLWERKLTEQLVDIVGFRHTRKDDFYRHYIVLREIERLSKISTDFYQYHGAKNKNIDHQLQRLKQEADQMVTGLDPSKCWYVRSITSTKGANYEIASFKQRLDRTLPWMSPNQRVMVGISYGEYSVQSVSLHPSQAKIKEEDPTMKTLDSHFMRVSMLAGEVVLGAKDAMNMHNKKGWLGNMSKANKSNEYPKELLTKLTKPDITVGDFVLAYGDLAEVVKVNKGKVGYRSFRVRYLETPPIPTIPVDEMPARYVRLYQKRKPIAEQVIKLLSEDGSKKPSIRLVNVSVRRTIVDYWTAMGGKELAFGKKDEGYKKMAEYLEQQKTKRAEPKT